MKASAQDIENLKKIQSINQEIAEKVRTFEQLPEKEEYLALLKKEKEISEKLSKVMDMKEDATSRFEKLIIEDSQLHEREMSVQVSIDEAAGDFRNLEVRTKELDGIASRRSLLADMLLKVDEEKEKIAALIKTLEEANSKIEAKKNSLNSKIVANKQEAEDFLQKYNKKLKTLYDALPEELYEMYKKSSSKVGSVVLSEIDGDKCKVCRSTLEIGTLLDLEKSGNVAICPHCERILIIDSK